MKRLLALCLLLALLCGCTLFQEPASQQTKPAETEEPQTPDITLRTDRKEALFALGWSPELGLDPYTSDSAVNRTFFPLIYEGLFQLSPDFEAEPLLCETWRSSEDELVWVFTLRQDAAFSNGVRLTAADVVYSLELAQDSLLYAARLAAVRSVTQSGQFEVTITLDRAMGSLPQLLDVPIIRSGSADAPLGTGPYALMRGESENYLERVAGWRGGEPPIGRVYLYHVDNTDSVRDAFEFGQVDLVASDLNAVGSVNFHSNYELWSQDSAILQFLSFEAESPLFRSAAVRAAVTHTIDRQALITDFFDGYGVAAALPAHPRSSCYTLSLAEEYAVRSDALSRAVIDAGLLGRQGKLLVSADNNANVAAAGAIASALREAGLEIDVVAVSGSDYNLLLERGGYDLAYCEVRLTPDFDMSAFFGGRLSSFAIQHEEAARLCASALENRGNFYDLHRLIMEEGLLCPLLFKTRAVMCRRGTVSGLDPAPENVFYGLDRLSILNH